MERYSWLFYHLFSDGVFVIELRDYLQVRRNKGKWELVAYPKGSYLMNTGLDLPREDIEQFCRRWHIAELSLFGSVLTPYFNENSDIDILVKFAPYAKWTLFDLVSMEDEIQVILKHKVDLVMKDGIIASKNTARKKAILGNAQVIYRDKTA